MLRGYQRSPKGEAVFDDAKRWEGWGTAMKPAHEPVCFARKPLSEGTVAANVLRWATGALNIDDARVSWQNGADAAAAAAAAAQRVSQDRPGRERWDGHSGAYLDPHGSLATWEAKSNIGRWPANVVTDGSLEVLEAFPPSARDAIRFFYSAKADKAERKEGLDNAPKTRRAGSFGDGICNTPKVAGERPVARANVHPTVKPVDLMRWLCRLVTSPGGTVLDPFMGSGSTGVAAVREGFGFVGIEQDPAYFDIACRRIAHAVEKAAREPDLVREINSYLEKPEQGTLL